MSRRTPGLHLILLALVVSLVLPAGTRDARAVTGRHDTEDLRESQRAAGEFLQHLKDGEYDGAYLLGASAFKSRTTSQNLKADVEARQQGGVVKSWRLKAYQTREGVPRYMLLLYHVEGSKTAGDWEFTMELAENPYQWRVWSIKGIDDSPSDRNAQAARATADQFLRCLRQHAYQIAERLFSPKGKMSAGKALRSYWEETEKRKGTLVDWTLARYGEDPVASSADRREYVVLVYRATRSRAEDEAVLTMVRIGTQWRVDAFELRDAPPASDP